MNSSSQTNSLKDILQSNIDDLEKQVLSRINSLEEGKYNPKNETEERGKIESTLTSLHQRISDLEKGKRHRVKLSAFILNNATVEGQPEINRSAAPPPPYTAVVPPLCYLKR